MTRRRRNANSSELTTIYWRDIPAQVTARRDTERQKILLTPRFQDAIDRAAGVAGLTNAHEYVAEWRRLSKPALGDLSDEVAQEARRIEDQYPAVRLRELIRRGGSETGPELRPAAPSSARRGDSKTTTGTQP